MRTTHRRIERRGGGVEDRGREAGRRTTRKGGVVVSGRLSDEEY